jgi:glucokinase
MLQFTEGDEKFKCNTGSVRRMNTLAIDIGGTKYMVALFENERMIRRESRPTDREGGPEWMLAQISAIARPWQKGPGFERCGIGFGGPVVFAGQQVALSTHVAGWQDFPLAARVKELFGVPVLIDNDANTAGLGEAMYGGHGALPLFYMTLSTGIGGGIVLKDGTVYRGADSWAGEIGHLTVRPGGPECLCGARGCLERMCCGLWLERDHGKPAQELFVDPRFVKHYVIDLALGLKAAIMLLNPARVVIGGGIAKAGEALFMPLREELGRQITSWSSARVDVRPAALGDDSVLWGALALARLAAQPETTP